MFPCVRPWPILRRGLVLLVGLRQGLGFGVWGVGSGVWGWGAWGLGSGLSRLQGLGITGLGLRLSDL